MFRKNAVRKTSDPTLGRSSMCIHARSKNIQLTTSCLVVAVVLGARRRVCLELHERLHIAKSLLRTRSFECGGVEQVFFGEET